MVVHVLVNLLLFEIRGVCNVYWHALGYVFLVVTLWWSERDCKKFKCGVRRHFAAQYQDGVPLIIILLITCLDICTYDVCRLVHV